MSRNSCEAAFDMIRIVGDLSPIAVVLGGFALVALVFAADRGRLSSSAAGQEETRLRQQAMGFLLLSLISLIGTAVLMAIAHGEQVSFSTRAVTLAGLAAFPLGLATLFLVLGVILLIRASELAPSPTMTFLTFVLFSVLGQGIAIFSIDELRGIVTGKCDFDEQPIAENIAMGFLAIAPGAFIYLLPGFKTKSFTIPRLGTDNSNAIWAGFLGIVVTLDALFAFVAIQSPDFQLHMAFWLALLSVTSGLIGWSLRFLAVPRLL